MPFGISAGISAGTSLLGGIFGKHSANSAANAVNKTAQQVASNINNAAGTAVSGVNAATQAGQADIGGAIQSGTAGVAGAIPAAIASVGSGTTAANQALSNTLQTQQSTLAPYLEAGAKGVNTLQSTLQDYLAPGGQLNQQFSFNPGDLSKDPGYQFQLDQGMKALQSSAAAQGLLRSGSTLKGIENYSQGLAGTEFQNAYNRNLTTFQTNRNNSLNTLGAINTLAGYGLPAAAQSNAAQQNAGNLTAANLLNQGYYGGNTTLSGNQFLANFGLSGNQALAGFGLQGASTAGQFGLGGAEAAGNALMQGATAAAQGRVAGTNALMQGFGGAANTFGQMYAPLPLPNGVILNASAPYLGSGGSTGSSMPMSAADWLSGNLAQAPYGL